MYFKLSAREFEILAERETILARLRENQQKRQGNYCGTNVDFIFFFYFPTILLGWIRDNERGSNFARSVREIASPVTLSTRSSICEIEKL